MNVQLAFRIAQIANLPVVLFAVIATYASLFGLNRNEGLLFWLVLLAPLELVAWLALAAFLREEHPSLALAMAYTPPALFLLGILFVLRFGR